MNNKFKPFPVIETERLVLRRLLETDKEFVFLLRSDERVNKYINRVKPNSIDDALDFINKRNENADDGVSIQWAISQKTTEGLIGTICLWNFSEDEKTAEMGYELHPDFQRKGLMNEAVPAIIKYGFEGLKLQNIEAFTQKDNINSLKLLQKNGFGLQPGRTDEDNPMNLVYTLSYNGFQVR